MNFYHNKPKHPTIIHTIINQSYSKLLLSKKTHHLTKKHERIKIFSTFKHQKEKNTSKFKLHTQNQPNFLSTIHTTPFEPARSLIQQIPILAAG